MDRWEGGGRMDAGDVGDWIQEIKAEPGSAAVGMMLVHQGVVRGTSRSGYPVRGMVLAADRARLERALDEAAESPGIFAVRGWVNEGELAVGDDIMKLLVAGDVREHVFAALERLVTTVKREVVTETELR
ncbi:MAG TPA: molybdenum cofactor biosynthesis protein MoaE [Thermoleophilia bacterium]|nr:molybdenum cofactor biosynthesis protein MoaE [Thermoleophilia bacterium]HQG03625.1 molybdenum cofactor biosynthesis protein MoaE [Thermoleophilia bacterium]HQG54816.1 molybdenum cofactor biosynthesis protein MoaE [Thermoleophilia bacterium]HQJ98077.1 molybdenum cofactor biosynthesis protein MoaE [Thermoleophilia bacterium]